MNAKRCKRLRKMARQLCQTMETKYHVIEYDPIVTPFGVVERKTLKLKPYCFRGTYKAAKRVVSNG